MIATHMRSVFVYILEKMPHRLISLGKAAFYRTKQLCQVPSCSYLVSKHRYATVSKPLDGETIRIGCASGFWGDTAVSGMTREVTLRKKSMDVSHPVHFVPWYYFPSMPPEITRLYALAIYLC